MIKIYFKNAGWRRSHRPSLYDISIINEDPEERDDPERNIDRKISEATNMSKNAPVFTVTK